MSEATLQVSRTEREAVMATGPSGLVIGYGQTGPIAMRLFRPTPTRIFLAVPEYIRWLLAFRAVCIGAHLSVIAADHRNWLGLVDTIRACGGTVDLLQKDSTIPGQGRAFRPSLVIDELGKITQQAQLGPWQALISVGDPAAGKAINDMRNCDLSMVSPIVGKAADNLRRAYALGPNQIKQALELHEAEVVLASVRRLVKLAMPPSPVEYRLLFGH